MRKLMILFVMILFLFSVHYVHASNSQYTISFKSGWNLFSVPVTDISDVSFTDCSPISPIYGYVDGSYQKATYTAVGNGYWVKMNSDCSVTFTGTDLTIDDFPALTAGWNLIGAPSTSININDALGNCNLVSGPLLYNSATNAFVQSSTLDQNKGYFVKVSADCQLGTGLPPLPSCTPACVNGDCIDQNVCSCYDGWQGAACDEPIETVTTQTTRQTVNPEEILPNAEKKFEETVCNILPDQAMLVGHLVSNVPAPYKEYRGASILIPKNLDSDLEAIGDSITFVLPYYIFTDSTSGEKYIDGKWGPTGNSNIHVIIIPITAELADDYGDKIATESGGIKLTFEGPASTVINSSLCNPGSGDGRLIGLPLCPAGPVPTYGARTGCEIKFEKACPEKEGYALCGQCHYSDFKEGVYGNYVTTPRVTEFTFGECKYCPEEKVCYGGTLAICTGVGFVCNPRSGGGGGGGGGGQYFVSCSACQIGQRSYYYSGYDYATCRYYYNLCVLADCADKRYNC